MHMHRNHGYHHTCAVYIIHDLYSLHYPTMTSLCKVPQYDMFALMEYRIIIIANSDWVQQGASEALELGLDKLCRHNFENNRRLKELRIMLE